ncbi:hypothetical protein [Pseudonocardia humida]|uniref:Uncharacterized protein n=1 Tax=Pseudonocardia humida TaxID=2800819 RepID=A0ABT1AC04_9PSEU|nr:hypothetical protein [Pseudonocardia humida]MCO1660491.1 hypothetical protein [Pseudonocardia humida]
MSARARRVATRATGSATGPRVPSAAELAAAVLQRTWPGGAGRGSADRAWRGRAADEAVLLMELCRWLEGRGRRRLPLAPVPAALAEAFAALARRGAPVGPARAFVELVVTQVHAVLAELEPDAEAPERASRDARLAVGLLEQCFRELAPTERVRARRLLALAGEPR